MNEETTKPSSVPNLKRTFKKSIGVFKTEFTVPAAFCVLAFFIFTVGTTLYFTILDGAYGFCFTVWCVSFYSFTGFLASLLCTFYTKKKLWQIICGLVATGFETLWLWVYYETRQDLFFLKYYNIFAISVFLVLLIMHKFYSGEKKGEALLFVSSKFFNSVILTLPFILLAVVIVYCFDNSLLIEAAIFFSISFSVISMFYFLSHVYTDSSKNVGVSNLETALYYGLPLIIFGACVFLQYIFLIIDFALHKFWNKADIRPCILFASVFYIYVYSIAKSHSSKFSKAFCKVAGIALLPLIVVQLVLLYNAYSTFGLTGSRICFLAYFVAVFVFIVISFFKNEKCTEKVYLVAAVIVFTLVVQPFGAERLGVYCQKAHLENYLIKKGIFDKKTLTIAKDWKALNLTQEDKEVMLGSYMYLNCKNFNYKNAIPDFCKQENFEENLFRID